jgi:hypothetical protein
MLCYAAHGVEIGLLVFVVIRGVRLGRWDFDGKVDVHVDGGGRRSRFGRRRGRDADAASL